MKAWDADMTPAERKAAINAEIERTRSAQRANMEHSWTDPRTANLLGNYVTR